MTAPVEPHQPNLTLRATRVGISAIFALGRLMRRPPKPPGATSEHAYGSDPAERLEFIEARAGAPRRAPIVYVHGGGWIAGRKESYSRFLSFLAEQGYPVFNVEYPLAPENPHPGILRSLFKALDWIRSEHPEHSGVHFMGDSAGGNLATMLGLLTANPALVRDVDPERRELPLHCHSVVSLYGVLDRLSWIEDGFPGATNMLESYAGKAAFAPRWDRSSRSHPWTWPSKLRRPAFSLSARRINCAARRRSLPNASPPARASCFTRNTRARRTGSSTSAAARRMRSCATTSRPSRSGGPQRGLTLRAESQTTKMPRRRAARRMHRRAVRGLEAGAAYRMHCPDEQPAEQSERPPGGQEETMSETPDDPTKSFGVRLVTNPVSTWLIRTICSPLDPLIFKATNGKWFTMGRPSGGMATITMTGRKTGKKRAVHLAAIPHEGDHLIIASAMGQQKHPAWRYNLEANPEVELQLVGERYDARAEVLNDEEKEKVWDKIRGVIPMVYVYEQRTDRNIRVFRLVRTEAGTT